MYSPTTGKLETCTYEEYQQEITATGECLKWGIDTVKRTFKVPTKINKIIAVNKNIPVKGNGKSIGLSNGVVNTSITNSAGTDYMYNTENGFDKPIGENINTHNGMKPEKALGIIPDSSKSGIVTDAQNTTYKEIRYFVVVATGSIKQSEMDWSQWASSLQGKANIDANNFSKVGKEFLSGLGMPSNKSIDLTVGASNTVYTAPANGWFSVSRSNMNNNNFMSLNYTDDTGNKYTGAFSIFSNSSAQNTTLRTFIPALKGQKVSLEYVGGTHKWFKFFYAEGSKE